MRVQLTHRTCYAFDREVVASPHLVRLHPAAHARTPVPSYRLTVTPGSHQLAWQQDAFGNTVARVVLPEPLRRLEFQVDLVADLSPINPFDFFVEPWAADFGFEYPDELRSDLAPYLAAVPGASQVAGWVRDRVDTSSRTPTVAFLVGLNQALAHDIAYTTRLEAGVHSPDETLRQALGSCRDSAWLQVAVLRELGLAARFVSGYLVDLHEDGPDVTDLHAWAEAFVPGAGWLGLDATSGLVTSEGHLPLAATSRPSAAAPVEGSTSPAEVAFEVQMSLERLP